MTRRPAPSDGRTGRRDQRLLGRILADIRRRVSDIEQADQADARAVTDGSMDVYDDDGNLRGVLGKQDDGQYALRSFQDPPETPTEPDVIPMPGGVWVEHDGDYEDHQPVGTIERIAIHVGETADFEIVTGEDDENEENRTELGSIASGRGGGQFIALDPGQHYYVRLTAVAHGGAESEPTDAVEAWVAAPEAKFWQDEFILTGGAENLFLTKFPIDNSEHLYWNGLYQREDFTWTRQGSVITLTAEPFSPLAGDRVTVEYAYLEDAPVPVEPLLIGTVSDEGGPTGTLPMPEGTISGDLMIVNICGQSGLSRSLDPRLTGSYRFSNDRITYWGFANASDSPISVEMTGFLNWACCQLTVLRGVRVLSITRSGTLAYNDNPVPVVEASQAAVVVAMTNDGTIASESILISDPDYTVVDDDAHDGKTTAATWLWVSDDQFNPDVQNPPATVDPVGGSPGDMFVATLRLGAL